MFVPSLFSCVCGFFKKLGRTRIFCKNFQNFSNLFHCYFSKLFQSFIHFYSQSKVWFVIVFVIVIVLLQVPSWFVESSQLVLLQVSSWFWQEIFTSDGWQHVCVNCFRQHHMRETELAFSSCESDCVQFQLSHFETLPSFYAMQ